MPGQKMPWTLDFIHSVQPWQVGAAFRRMLRYRSEVREVRGLKLWLDPSSNIGYRLLKNEDLEIPMREYGDELLKPGDSYVDLGGNEGWYSLLAARRVGKEGRVLCVEPQERLWPILLRNFALNGFTQCELVPVAVGEDDGEAEIALAPGVNTGASSMAVKGGWRRMLRKHQKVMVRPLDAIVRERGMREVTVLKVDIEGYEVNALRSGASLFRDHVVKHVLIEYHDPELQALGQSRKEILDLFAKNGYREVREWGGVYHYSCV